MIRSETKGSKDPGQGGYHPPAAPVLSGNIEKKTEAWLNWTQNSEPDLLAMTSIGTNRRLIRLISGSLTMIRTLRKASSPMHKVVDLAGNESTASNELK
jgi:hypothetical protein